MCVDEQGRPCRAERVGRTSATSREVMQRLRARRPYAVLLDGGTAARSGSTASSVLERVARGRAAPERQRLRRRPRGARAGAGCARSSTSTPASARCGGSSGLHDAVRGTRRLRDGRRERSARPDCTIPTCGLDWITTPQPVVLDALAVQAGDRATRFTSVGSWRGPFGPIEFEGETYGLRVHEFRRFADAAAASRRQPFEIALDIDEADAADVELLREGGWALADPRRGRARPLGLPRLRAGLEGRVHGRQEHVRAERAAAGSAIAASATWPAAGRCWPRTPASRSCYPTGEGLLAFDDLEEAVAGVEAIARRLRAPLPRGARARGGALRLGHGPAAAAGAAGSSLSSAMDDERRRHEPRIELSCRGADGAAAQLGLRRVDRSPGWINSDIKDRPGRSTSSATSARACRSRTTASTTRSASTRCRRSPTPSSCRRCSELRRVLKPGGVLRLALPDLDKGIDAYRGGDEDYFLVPDEDAKQRSARSSSCR